MKKQKIIIILLISIILIGGYYIISLKKSLNDTTPQQTTSIVTVERWKLTEAISVTGKAELANEQKLRFGQNGKITDIYVKVGDTVEKDQVLASIDKREFFQEMAQAQNRIDKTKREIAQEQEKSTGTEAARMAREISSMERKLQEMEEDLTKTVQNSPDKWEEKLLDINAKKRELQEKKDKYEIEKSTYEKEYAARDTLVENKIQSTRKLIEETIKGSSTELNNLRDGLHEINKLFAFNNSELNDEEMYFANQFRANNTGHEIMVKDLWWEINQEIRDYRTISEKVNRNSLNPEDAISLIEISLRANKKLLEAIDIIRKMTDSIPVGDGAYLVRSELSSVNTTITSLRSNVSAKITSLTESKESLILIDSPEKIKEKFLAELNAKKIALESAYDDIKRLEIQIAQSERETVIEWGHIIDTALKREIADKQSAIQDQKDAILTKKEDLEKLQSGKSDALEDLQSTLKDQLADLEKMSAKEETFEIRAPFSGTVRSIQFKIGDIIGWANGDTTWAEKVLLLENSDIINIKVALNQLDIIKVQMNQRADIFFEAVPDAAISGEITEISSTPSNNNDTGLAAYDVVISALRENYPIYSGMNATITIPMNETPDVLLIPTTSISEDIASGELYVNVVQKDGSIQKTIITTGKTNWHQTQVLSGLEEWQQIQIIDFNANTFKSEDFSHNVMY